MILLVDNYDSFSYNLYQLVGSIETDIRVIRNDEMTISGIRELAPSHIILSPGPGKPRDAGRCEEIVRELGREIPILGVCLGHQAICEVFGLEVTYANNLMHGKQSIVDISRNSELFRGLPNEIQVARYHSLVAKDPTGDCELIITARSKEGEIMAVEHKKYPIYGVQFHPESILTPDGKQMILNFLGR